MTNTISSMRTFIIAELSANHGHKLENALATVRAAKACGADAIKIGMLGTSEVIEAVAKVLETHAKGLPVVVDPVMVAKGGNLLLQPSAAETMKKRLLPHALVLTPNVPEA